MNNTFDWNRFCKVVNKDFRNLWPTFGTTAIVLATLPFAVWLLSLVISRDFVIDPNYRVTMIMGVSSLAAVMLPSRLYRTMNLRNEGIYYAMLPASKLEKFLSMLLFTFIVAPVVVYLGSLVLDIILRLMPARSDIRAAAQVRSDIVVHTELETLLMKEVSHSLESALELDFIMSKFAVNSLRLIATVIKNDVFISQFIKTQLYQLIGHRSCELFVVAASESVPTVPTHKRKPSLCFAWQILAVIKRIKSQ